MSTKRAGGAPRNMKITFLTDITTCQAFAIFPEDKVPKNFENCKKIPSRWFKTAIILIYKLVLTFLTARRRVRRKLTMLLLLPLFAQCCQPTFFSKVARYLNSISKNTRIFNLIFKLTQFNII